MDIYKNVEIKDITDLISNIFRKKIRNEEDIEKYLKLKVLGIVPIYSEKIQKLNEENSSKEFIEESINKIRKNILDTISEKNKSILITSCNQGEGKSWISVNIGLSLASVNKKVLLIVTDMLKKNSNEVYNINDVKKNIKRTSVINFDILTNGASDLKTTKLPNKDKLNNLIENLKESYDIIIIDGPSSDFIKDSSKLSSICDSTIIVASSNQTKINDIKKLSNSIKKSGGTTNGAILNKYQKEGSLDEKAENDSNKLNIKNKEKTKNKQKDKNKEANKLYLKLIIKKQNKHIEKLEKIILQLNKKLDNNLKVENAVNEQNGKFKKELENNNEELKRIIAEEIIKMQENLKEEIRQEVISTQERINNTKAEIQKETREKIEKMEKDIEVDTRKKIEEIKKETNKEIVHIQKKIKEETKQEISKIDEDKNEKLNEIRETIYEEIEKIQDKKESKKEIEVKDEVKTVHSINEDINYEDLEKTASYIISLNKEEKQEKEKAPKEYKFNMRYIYGKYFRRDKIYN